MKNEAKFFEMTEEQLDMVAGGTARNTLTQGNTYNGSTTNVAMLTSNANQYGSINSGTNNSSQTAQDSWSTVTKTWANLFSYNYPY